MNKIPLALFVLRLGLAIFFLQWGIEKFVAPESTAGIFTYFYGMTIPAAVGYLFGAAEVILALCLAAGAFKTAAYGAAAIIHAVSVLVAWQPLLHPWADPVSHLFIAGIPVLAACVALFLAREHDTLSVRWSAA